MFQFGIGRQRSSGILEVQIPVYDSFLHLRLGLVPANLPFLIGLDVIDKYQVSIDAARYRMTGLNFAWPVPLTRKHGHLYYDWTNSNIIYKNANLLKLHKQFFHRTAKKCTT